MFSFLEGGCESSPPNTPYTQAVSQSSLAGLAQCFGLEGRSVELNTSMSKAASLLIIGVAACDALTLLRVAPRANARMLFGGGGEGGEGGGMNMMETSACKSSEPVALQPPICSLQLGVFSDAASRARVRSQKGAGGGS